jgi:hypothetical protein
MMTDTSMGPGQEQAAMTGVVEDNGFPMVRDQALIQGHRRGYRHGYLRGGTMSGTAHPRVTVLMTLYNKGAYVGEAVGSVLANTFTDLEVLVVDDASTDDGLAKVRSIADKRVRVLVSDRNTGRANAANRGYDAALGEYVAVMDADDLMHPARLAEQVAYLDAHPEVGACGSWLEFFGGSDTVHRLPATDDEARALMLFGVPVSYGACMFRRSVLERFHLRCPAQWSTPGMDYLFMLDVGRHTRYANIQVPLTRYRIGEQNMRHGRDPFQDDLLLFNAVFALLSVPASEADVRSHLILLGHRAPVVTAAEVRAVAAWRNTLLEWARRSGGAPVPGLMRQLDQRWDGLFHHLLRTDLPVAWSHWRCSEKDRARDGWILAKALVKKLVGVR